MVQGVWVITFLFSNMETFKMWSHYLFNAKKKKAFLIKHL